MTANSFAVYNFHLLKSNKNDYDSPLPLVVV